MRLMLMFLLVATSLLAVDLPAVDLPAGGVDLGAGVEMSFRAKGDPATTTGALVAITDGPAKQVWRVVAPKTDNFWDTQMVSTIPSAAAKGDVGLLSVWLKMESALNEQTEAAAVLYIQRSGPPWNKATMQSASIGPQWEEYLVPFVFDDNYKAGKSEVGVGLGNNCDQVVLVGPVRVMNYGTSLTMADLPRTSQHYAGRELDAPWRLEAAKRIEQFRKGDLTIKVIDAAGKPVPQASVQVAMTRHAFPFGSAAVASRINGTAPQNETYRQNLLKNFNAVVMENDLKWVAWKGDWGNNFSPDKTVKALRWLQDNQMFVRGHVMMWPSWKNSPKFLKELENDPEALKAAAFAHIDDMCAQTAGLINAWDVVNEPYAHHNITDILGAESLGWWFQRTFEKVEPKVPLYLNDYGILATGGDTDTQHQAYFEQMVRTLQAAGIPISGMGFQSHIGGRVTAPDRVWTILDRFTKLNLPISITEFDITTDDDALRADYTRDFLTACFAHPNVEAFVCWGFWAGAHWTPSAAMYTKDWTLQDNGKQWQKLIYHDWWTNETVQTNAAGQQTVRGFMGTYDITVRSGDQMIIVPATIGSVDTTVVVTVP